MEREANATIEGLNELNKTRHMPVIIVLVIIMCIGIVGNVLVLLIYKNRWKRSSARVYILSLAMVDFTVCIFGIPYHVLDLTFILTYPNVTLCKVLSYLIGAFTLSSSFILLIIGMDRYLKVCRPLKRQIVDFGDKTACIIAVFGAAVISIPVGILYGHSSVETGVNNITGVECFVDDRYFGSSFAIAYLSLYSLIYLVTVSLLIIIYSLVFRKILVNDSAEELSLQRKQRACLCCFVESTDEVKKEEKDFDDILIEMETLKSVDDNLGQNKSNSVVAPRQKSFNRNETMRRHSRFHDSKMKEKNTRKITLMMMTIVIVFIIAHLPFLVISIMDSLDDMMWDDITDTKLVIVDLLLRIYLLNNVANPIIYRFWDVKFRKAATGIFRNILCGCRKAKSEIKETDNVNTLSRVTSEYTVYVLENNKNLSVQQS